MEGDGEGGGEAGGQREEEEEGSDKSDEITQRILNIMANFLEGEVWYYMYLCFSQCSRPPSLILNNNKVEFELLWMS